MHFLETGFEPIQALLRSTVTGITMACDDTALKIPTNELIIENLCIFKMELSYSLKREKIWKIYK